MIHFFYFSLNCNSHKLYIYKYICEVYTVVIKSASRPLASALCMGPTTDLGLTLPTGIKGHACLKVWKHAPDPAPERQHAPPPTPQSLLGPLGPNRGTEVPPTCPTPNQLFPGAGGREGSKASSHLLGTCSPRWPVPGRKAPLPGRSQTQHPHPPHSVCLCAAPSPLLGEEGSGL